MFIEEMNTFNHPIFIGWINNQIPDEIMADWAAEKGMSDEHCLVIRYWGKTSNFVLKNRVYAVLIGLCIK